MALLRTILIIIIVTYIIRLFTRYILPAMFFNFMDDKAREFTKQQKKEYQRSQQAKKREGEVSVDYSPQSNNKNKPRSGVYVDYEEVKD
jgi:flagellar basal body-associated protein FliL